LKTRPCSDDVDYQSSTNALEAHWIIPTHMRDYIQDAFWAVEQRAPVAGI